MRRGTVYQRHTRACPRDPDGRYAPHKCRGSWAYYLLAGRGPQGKRRQVTKAGFPTKRAAEAALREVLAREDAEIAEVHKLTVSGYLAQWLDGKRALRPTTRRSYESHMRLYLDPYLGNIRLSELRPHHLDPLFSDLLAQEDGARKAATVRRVHATLRSALNTAVKRRLIPWNPALHIELPSPDRHAATVWTPEQLGEFLDSIAEHRLYALFHIVAIAGLRRGEALGLRWEDVDLDTALVRVTQQLVESAQGLRFGPPKTRSGVRAVPLDEGTITVLRDHRARQDEDRAGWGEAWHETGLVFTRENGAHVRPDYVSHLFRRLVEDAGLPPIRFHDLRHTSASLALAAGVPIKVVSHRLGHSSTAITADLYTHVVPVVARDAADAIAGIVPRRPRHSRDQAKETADEPMSSGDLAQTPSERES